MQVEQALLVSSELIRVAILWHEQWHEGLEEASRLYFGDGNIKVQMKSMCLCNGNGSNVGAYR